MRLGRRVVPVDRVTNHLGPEANGGPTLGFVRSRKRADHVYYALRDRVKVMIVWGAGRRVQRLVCSEGFKLSRLQAAFVVSVKASPRYLGTYTQPAARRRK